MGENNEHVKNHFEHNGTGDKKHINKYEYEAEFSHVQEKMAVCLLLLILQKLIVLC